MATAAPRAAEADPTDMAGPPTFDAGLIARELSAVADYIKHIRREIGALQANELYRDRIPMAHEELGSVVKATASATNTILAAAEDILESNEPALDRQRVETKLLQILEACAFQDITGQRITKVVDALTQLEKRLGRFAAAVKIRDAEDEIDPEEALRQARREVLMLHGPQSEDKAIAQDDIDQLFG